MPETSFVTTSITNQIATVTFYHPKGNSLPGEMLRKLAQTIRDIDSKERARVIVLKSKGDGAFCAGASFDELMEISSFDEGKRFFMGFAEVLNAMRKCSRLIIVRVQGKTVGGGVGIAAAGDYTLAHDSASVKLSELALGIGPFVVGPAIERKIGKAAFSSLALDASSWHDASWAHKKGLFAQVHSSFEELDRAVEKLAVSLSEKSPVAMEELKKMLWEGTDHWDTLLEKRAEISGRLVLSDFTKKFIARFKSS